MLCTRHVPLFPALLGRVRGGILSIDAGRAARGHQPATRKGISRKLQLYHMDGEKGKGGAEDKVGRKWRSGVSGVLVNGGGARFMLVRSHS